MAVTLRASSENSGICNYLSKVADNGNWPLPLIVLTHSKIQARFATDAAFMPNPQSDGVKVRQDRLA